VRQWTYNGRTYVLPSAQEAEEQADGEGDMTEGETQPNPVVQASAEPAPESSWFGTVLLVVIATTVVTMVGMLVLGNGSPSAKAQPISAVVVVTPKRSPETSTSITVTRHRKVREYTAGASSSSLLFQDNRSPAERAADDNVPTDRIAASRIATDRIATDRIDDDDQFRSEEPANITSRIAAKHRETQRRSKSAV
jgi:hypothetical protein